MKNIALSASWRSVIPDVNITNVAIDVDNSCLWITSERLNADADIEIDVYKRGLPRETYELQDVSVRFLPGISSQNQSHHDITHIHY